MPFVLWTGLPMDGEKLSQPPIDPLNKRETEILTRLSAGLTDQQIAEELFLSLNTVKWYNRQIYQKLGVHNRAQAIQYFNQL